MNNKQEIITFKVEEWLMEKLRQIPNRSEFIRKAVVEAMEGVCPVCQGRGYLSPKQREHFDTFLEAHELETCDSCHEVHIVCRHGE